MSKYKSKRVAGEPGTVSYRGFKIYNNKGEEGAPYLIYAPGQFEPDDAAETLRDSKALIDGFLGKKFGGVIKKMRLGGLTSADPIGDKRRKEDAAVLRKLKKTVKPKKVKTKPVKLTIQSASITKPAGMNIQKNMIMPKMAKEGGLMTKGNLRDAIEKVKAKEMQGGGEAKSGGKAVSINTPTGRRKMAEIRKIMPGASVDEVKEFGLKAGILKMKEGGEAVPPKFKGFSKLPESVQQKMNPDLAEKFGMGGDVKGKKGKNICRGRGIARPGTGFTIR